MNKEYIKTEVDDLVYRPLEIMEEKNTHDLRWVKKADGKKSIILDYLFEFTNDFERHPYLVESVLAEVPSYEEWQSLKEFADYSIHNRDELTKQINFWMDENTKLKELLKECSRLLSFEHEHYEDENIVKEISQVLGEE